MSEPVKARIHYGVPGLRSACGHYRHLLTSDRRDVTCHRCKGTVKFERGHFGGRRIKARA